MNRTVLPEISQTRQTAGRFDTPFPTACPACGAVATVMDNAADILEWKRVANYACGGGYSYKSQIQNHTEKWWGVCPTGRENPA